MKRSLKREIKYRYKRIFGGEYYIPKKDIKRERPHDYWLPENQDGLSTFYAGHIKSYYYYYRYRINKWMRIKYIDLKLFILKITQKIISKI